MFDFLMQKIFPGAALILSVVNGFYVFFKYMSDKPKLIVSPVHPELYQCWTRLADVSIDDKIIRRYVFLSYFSVANQGLRDVAVNEWRLHIKNKLFLRRFWHKKKELFPCNLPEIQCNFGDHVKLIRAFGQSTPNFQSSSNMIKSGDSISGMACWIYSVYGGEGWSPKTDKSNDISAVLKIKNVFGKESYCKILFRELTFNNLKKKFPNVAEYFESLGESVF